MTLTKTEEIQAYTRAVEKVFYDLNKPYLDRKEAMKYVKSVAGSDATFKSLVDLGLQKIQLPEGRKIAYARADIDAVLNNLKY